MNNRINIQELSRTEGPYLCLGSFITVFVCATEYIHLDEIILHRKKWGYVISVIIVFARHSLGSLDIKFLQSSLFLNVFSTFPSCVSLVSQAVPGLP